LKNKLKKVLSIIVITLIGLGGCKTALQPVSTPPVKRVLKAAFVPQNPKVDGLGDDAVWKTAQPLIAKGPVSPKVTMKAVISGDTITVLLSWPDATNDNVDEVWEYDGAGWKKGPIDDAVAMFWDIDRSVKGFETKGCLVVCHAASWNGHRMSIEGPLTPKGIWAGAKQRGDIWDMSLAISNVRGAGNDYYFGIMEQYLKSPSTMKPFITRRHDAFTAKAPLELNETWPTPGYPGEPLYRLTSGLTVENTPYPQLTQVELITDYSVFKAGDRIPYILFYPLNTKWGGSRDDIKGKGVWKNGRWTVEMSRKLNTGHPEDDVIFKPESGKTKYYVFDVAVFDRTIADHTYTGPIALEVTK
jgi:hypothetical protein